MSEEKTTVEALYLAAKAAWRDAPDDPEVVARFNMAEAALAAAREEGVPDMDAITPDPIAGTAGLGE